MSSSSTLCFRGTFIHVQVNEREGQRRARTVSPPRSPADSAAAPGVLDGQREYVAGLGDRLATLWGATKPRDRFVFDGKSAPAPISDNFGFDGAKMRDRFVFDGRSAPAPSGDNFDFDGTIGDNFGLDGSVALAAVAFHGISAPPVVAKPPVVKQLERQAANQMASALLLQAKLASMSGEGIAAVLAPPPSGDSETRAPSSDLSLDNAESPKPCMEDMTPAGGNEGSFGHPFMCSRPCLHFASGKCTHAAACEFCHLEHSRRPVHLDKKHREMLHTMPSDNVIMLILPLLRQKMLVFDSSVESIAAFDDFAKSCGVDPNVVSAASFALVPRSQRTLLSMCRAMSFRSLLQTLRRVSLHGDAAEAQALTLLAHLRGEARRVAALDGYKA